MGEPLDRGEFVYQLPAPHKPLSPEGEIVVRCANCVLSQFVEENIEGPPGIMLSYIPPCTKLSRSTAASTFRILDKVGWVTAQPLPSDTMIGQLYGSANPPTFFVPQVDETGHQNLRPYRRPGCERTIQHNIVDTLARHPREVLEDIAGLMIGGSIITRDALHENLTIRSLTLASALRLFVETGLLSQAEQEYQLTERGLWLLRGLPAEPKPDLRPRTIQSSPIQSHTKAAPKPQQIQKPNTGPEVFTGVVDRWLVDKAKILYGTNSPDAIRGLKKLLVDGVLQVSGGDRSVQHLGFSERATRHTSQTQQKAIAIWQKVDRLLYPDGLHPPKILRALGLSLDASLESYTGKVIYRKLLEEMADEQKQD